MASLEAFVRPAVAPDLRPTPTQIVVPQDDDRLVTIASSNARLINLKHSHSWSWNKQTFTETGRTFDIARVSNTSNRDNFVDVEVPYKVRLRDGTGSPAGLRLDRVQTTENTEIIATDQIRGGAN